MQSKKFTLNAADLKKWGNNTLLFLSPVLLMYLTFVAVAVRNDGFQLSDFVPSAEALTAIVLWFVNTLIDLLRKFTTGK